MENKLEKIFTKNLVIIMAFAITSLILYHSLYAHPAWDDFSYANKAIKLGIFKSTIREYLHWSGRYSATWLMGVYSVVFGLLKHFYVMSISVIIFLIFSIFFFIFSFRALQFKPIKNIELIKWVGLTWILFIAIVPWKPMYFFQMAFAFSYSVGNAFFLVLLGILIRNSLIQKIHIGIWIICPILAFIVAGFNEALMLFQSILMASIIGWIVWISFSEKRIKPCLCLWVVTFIASIIGIVVVALNPGSQTRLMTIHLPYAETEMSWLQLGYLFFHASYNGVLLKANILQIITYMIVRSVFFLAPMTLGFYILIVGNRYLASTFQHLVKPFKDILIQVPIIIRSLALCAYIGAFSLIFGIYFYVSASYPSTQIISMNILFFIISSPLLFAILGSIWQKEFWIQLPVNTKLKGKQITNKQKNRQNIFLYVNIVIWFLIIVFGNIGNLVKDLPNVANFDKQMQNRYEILKNSSVEELPHVIFQPKMLFGQQDKPITIMLLREYIKIIDNK